MDEYLIAQFLREQGLKDPKLKAQLIRKVTKYPDIKEKFLAWMESRAFDDILKIEEWTASDIHKLAPFLTGIGVYNFLVDLRDNPDDARKCITDGFPVM